MAQNVSPGFACFPPTQKRLQSQIRYFHNIVLFPRVHGKVPSALFILPVEPLSSKLGSSQSIEYKVSLYADDLLLYLSDPLSCVPDVVKILKDYGYLFIHCFPVNYKADQIKETDLPFCISKAGFRYLGINITHSYSGLFKANYSPIIKKT